MIGKIMQKKRKQKHNWNKIEREGIYIIKILQKKVGCNKKN